MGVEAPGDFAIGGERFERHLPVAARGEHASDGVVVLVGDGVELVVVAASAPKSHAEERLPEGVDPVVGAVGRILGDVDRRMDLLAEIPKACSDHRLIGAGGVQPGTVEKVAGDLLADELVVGEIGVEAVDHPVAITPGVGNGEVELVATRLAIADDVEPVAGKPLAEVGGCEEPVDILLIGQRIGIGDDAIDLGRIGRKPGEQLGGPANELPPGCLRYRRQAGRLQARKHEAVDVVAAPANGLDRRRRHRLRRLPAPVIGFAGGDVEAPCRCGHRSFDGPREPPANPLLERGDRLGRQPAIGGHLELAVVADDLDEQTHLRLPRRSQPLVAEGLGPGVEGEIPLRLTGGTGMTGRAMLEEQRPDPRLEKLGILGRWCLGQLGGPRRGNDRCGHHQDRHSAPQATADHETRHVEVLRGPQGPRAQRPARPRSVATPMAGKPPSILPPRRPIGTAKTSAISAAFQRNGGPARSLPSMESTWKWCTAGTSAFQAHTTFRSGDTSTSRSPCLPTW